MSLVIPEDSVYEEKQKVFKIHSNKINLDFTVYFQVCSFSSSLP